MRGAVVALASDPGDPDNYRSADAGAIAMLSPGRCYVPPEELSMDASEASRSLISYSSP